MVHANDASPYNVSLDAFFYSILLTISRQFYREAKMDRNVFAYLLQSKAKHSKISEH